MREPSMNTLAGYEGMARIKQFDDRLYYVVKGTRNWADAGDTPSD